MEKIGHSSTTEVAVPSSVASEHSLNQPAVVLDGDATEKGAVLNENGPDSTEQTEGHLAGPQLFFVMFSATLAVFLMLLDSSIVATVSHIAKSTKRCS